MERSEDNTNKVVEDTLKECARKFKGRDLSKFNETTFEKHVCELISDELKKNGIELFVQQTGKLDFPDILIGENIGVEVKTVRANTWRGVGNSVFENTRRLPEDSTIFVFFGKLIENGEAKVRRYEECLEDIKVTHSPRYAINMVLDKGDSVLDKLNLKYSEIINKSENEIISIFKSFYLKNKSKNDAIPWWIGDSNSSPALIRYWSDLGLSEKRAIMLEIFSRFPEVFSSNYKKVAAWLIVKKSIVNPSLRDPFSAGSCSQKTFEHGGGKLSIKLRGALKTFYTDGYDEEVMQYVKAIPVTEAEDLWGIKFPSSPTEAMERKVIVWKGMFKKNLEKMNYRQQEIDAIISSL
ncbi:MAG: hypothetical protein D6732_28570 [Methanobacteriota archaeon]|nr:MAG: hypothetical protein D6732_28570 [Euryarchaeota archaeon]